MISQWLSRHDADIVDPSKFNAALYFEGYSQFIPFQFPPKFLKDSRSFKWTEASAYGLEPIQSYEGNRAREMTIKWQYVVEVDEYDVYSNYWSIGKIKEAVNMLRAYHALTGNTVSTDADALQGLVMRMRMYGVAGPGLDGTPKSWTVNLQNVNVTYSNALVGPPAYAYPLITTITADIRLWTSTISASASGSNLVSVDGLEPSPTIEDFWY